MNTNFASINTLINNINLSKKQSILHTQRLSTGLKINSAADDPSMMLRINRLNSAIRGHDAASKNVQDGMSLIQKAQDSLSVMNNMAQRLKELSVQYNNETISTDDKASIEKESVALLKEMNNIRDNTEFNGQNVFSKSQYNLQIGDKSTENFTLNVQCFPRISNSDLDKGLLSLTTEGNSTTKTITKTTTTSTTTGTTNTSGSSTTNSNTSSTGTTSTNSTNTSTTTTQIKKPDPILAQTFGIDIPDTSESTYVKLHDTNGTLIYEGNILNGKFDGYGTLYDNNGHKAYQGGFTEGAYNGYGTQYASDGHMIYQGETSFGTINNYGTQYSNDGSIVYQGTTKYGVKDGYGYEVLSNGYKYNGYYTNDIRSGWGNMTDASGNTLYAGIWKDDKPADGTVICGYTPKTVDNASTSKDSGATNNTTTNNSTTSSGTTATNSTSTTNGTSTSNGTTVTETTTISETTTQTIPGQATTTTGELFTTLFSKDYIDKYILKPISESLSQLGIQEKVLNYHNDWLQSQRNLDEESLSRIQDADMAKELLEKTRADMLQQTSLSLFTQTLDFNKNNILALLN